MNLNISGYNRWQDCQQPYNQLMANTCNISDLVRRLRGYNSTRWQLTAEDYLIPYMINDINYHGIQMFIPSDLTVRLREYKDRIENYTVDTPKTFNMCIIYTNNIEDADSWMPESYEELIEDETPTGIAISQFKNVMQRLFDDCDEGITSDFKFYKSTTKNSLVTVCNACYNKQFREHYFTLALSQLVYPELYEDFTQQEKDIYLELLHQMYLKRIVKTRIQEKADTVACLNKYTDYFSDRNVTRTISLLIKQRIQSLKCSVDNYANQASDLLNQYTQAVANFNNASKELLDKEANSASELNELKQTLNQPFIQHISISGDIMQFTLQSYMDFYDTDLLDCVLNGLSGVSPESENFKIFLTEVFKEQRYKLRVQSNFQYNLNVLNRDRGTYSLRVNQADYDAETNERLCNPHLLFFSCLGSYAAQLAKAQADSNLDVFISLALASTRSINFADGAVCSRWKGYFDPDNYNNWLNRRCLEDEEGNIYTIKEVIDKAKYADIPVIEPQDILTPEEREAEYEW